MFEKNNFFYNYYLNSKTINKNIKKTKRFFNTLLNDFENFDIPLLKTFENNYSLDFSPSNLKKFSHYKNIVIIGMGGSILGTKSIYSFFKTKIKKKVFFFDNLDSNLHEEYKKIKNLNNSCFIIISKSGTTLETLANFCIIFSKNLFKNKLIIITENKDSTLMQIANEYDAEIIEHKDFIGGRYSVLSEVGMIPAALMGLNVSKFRNINKLIKNKKFISCLIYNVACIYSLKQKGIKNSVLLNYDSSLNDLCYWYQQLTGESLGKKGLGITPIISFGPKDHHSVLQLYLDGPKDKFFTFFTFKDKRDKFKISKKIVPNSMKFMRNKSLQALIDAQSLATKNVFSSKKIPFRQINLSKSGEGELGKIFIFFILETILLGRMLNINPFDQPAVEQVKTETKKNLL